MEVFLRTSRITTDGHYGSKDEMRSVCSTILLLSCVAVFGGVSAVQTWSVQNEANMTCLIVESEPLAHVTFTDKNGTAHSYTVAINTTHEVTGNCNYIYGNKSANSLTVRFMPNGESPSSLDTQEWILDMVFVSQTSEGDDAEHFKLAEYSLTTAPRSWMEGSVTEELKMAKDTAVEVEAHGINAFKCSTTNLALAKDSSIELKNLKAIAFASLNTTEFDKDQAYEQCSLDMRTSDIVPIIVGACLAGLVVIVLVAYLIGRARAKRQGYASV